MVFEYLAIGSHVMRDILAFGPIAAVLYYNSQSAQSASIEVLQEYFNADGFAGSLWQAAISNGPLWAIYWAICTSVPPFVAAVRDLLLAWSASIYWIWKSAEWCVLFYFDRVANPDFRFLFVVALILAAYGFFVLGFWYHLTRCLIRLFVAIARLTAYCTQMIISHAERLLLASVDLAFWGFRALTLPLVVFLNYWMESWHDVHDALAGSRRSSEQDYADLAVTFRRIAVFLYALYISMKTLDPIARFIQRCLFGAAADGSQDLTPQKRPETTSSKRGEPAQFTAANASRVNGSQRTLRRRAVLPGRYPSSEASEASASGGSDADEGHGAQQSVGRRRSPRFAPASYGV